MQVRELRDLCSRCRNQPHTQGSPLCRFCCDFLELVARSDQKLAALLDKMNPGDGFLADSYYS